MSIKNDVCFFTFSSLYITRKDRRSRYLYIFYFPSSKLQYLSNMLAHLISFLVKLD